MNITSGFASATLSKFTSFKLPVFKYLSLLNSLKKSGNDLASSPLGSALTLSSSPNSFNVSNAP